MRECFSECAVLMMPFNEALTSGGGGSAEFLYTVDHDKPRLGYEFVVVVCDVVVEFGLGEGLVVGDFVSLGGLVSDDCIYPVFSRSFVKSRCYAEFGGNSFEAGEIIVGKGLLCVGWMGHN